MNEFLNFLKKGGSHLDNKKMFFSQKIKGIFTNLSLINKTSSFLLKMPIYIGLDKQNFERKILNNLLPISFNICLGAQKNRLIETVLLSTHNICFG